MHGNRMPYRGRTLGESNEDRSDTPEGTRPPPGRQTRTTIVHGSPPCAELNAFVVPNEDERADSASKIAGSGFRDLSFRRAHAAMTAAHDPFANCRITGNFGRMVIPACPS
ncbi:hypothetical protein [Nocardia sp. NPDC004260]